MTASRPSRRAPLLKICAALVFVFIYLPIVVLIAYSFNRDGVGGFPPRHVTLDWYRQLFADGAIWDAVLNSLIVAAASVLLALTLGLLAALALDRADFPGKSIFRRVVLLPLILPGIITGLSLLMFAVFSGIHLTLLTVFLGHGTALISVAKQQRRSWDIRLINLRELLEPADAIRRLLDHAQTVRRPNAAAHRMAARDAVMVE